MLLVGATASIVFTQRLVSIASLTSKTMEACTPIVSPVWHRSAIGLILKVTKPSPTCVESLTARKPRSLSVGAMPVIGSIEENIQNASFLVMSIPATTSTNRFIFSTRSSRVWYCNGDPSTGKTWLPNPKVPTLKSAIFISGCSFSRTVTTCAAAVAIKGSFSK